MALGAIAAGIGGAASLLGGLFGGDEAPAYIPANLEKSNKKYLDAMEASLPQLADLEGQYRPQFGDLNIADQQQYLNALLGMSGQAQNAASGQLETARDQDLAGMTGRAPAAIGLIDQIDPQGRQQVQQAGQLANDAYARSQGLNFEEKRAADQQAREAFGSRGRINDNAGVAGEIMNRQSTMAANRAEAAQLGQNAFNQSQGFTQSILGLLNQIPGSIGMGQNAVTQSQGAVGMNTPQLINPDAGINIGMQNAANAAGLSQANASNQSNFNTSLTGLGSDLLGYAAKNW